MKSIVLTVIVCLTVCFVVAWGPTGSHAPAQDKVAATKWEYRFYNYAEVAEFNKLGDEGWEVAVSYGPSRFVFKRPKR